MEREEAIAVASAWVNERYPTVPPIIRVHQFTEDDIALGLSEEVMEMNPQLDNDHFRSKFEALRGKWWVIFAAEKLRVWVDPVTSSVELMDL